MNRSIEIPRPKAFRALHILALMLFLCLLSPAHSFGAGTDPLGASTNIQRIAQAEPASPGQAATSAVTPEQAPSAEAAATPDAAVIKTVREALLKESFSYTPKNLINPFLAFITPTEAAPPTIAAEDDELGPPLEPQRPLTPLQKMKISEIEKGLKAITWGDLGRRAIIEDAAGKGYIVGVGTPVGEKNGVITEIFNDHLVIQQEFWDKKTKRMVPQNYIVKLVKVQPK